MPTQSWLKCPDRLHLRARLSSKLNAFRALEASRRAISFSFVQNTSPVAAGSPSALSPERLFCHDILKTIIGRLLEADAGSAHGVADFWRLGHCSEFGPDQIIAPPDVFGVRERPHRFAPEVRAQSSSSIFAAPVITTGPSTCGHAEGLVNADIASYKESCGLIRYFSPVFLAL